MQLSKEDTFCWQLAGHATEPVVSTNVLDFGSQGLDALSSLYIVVLVTTAMAGAGTFAVTLETCAAEAFGSDVTSHTLASGLLAAALAKGKFAVNNAILPKGLLRYNRLVFTPASTVSTVPAFSAFIVDGRVEPLE